MGSRLARVPRFPPGVGCPLGTGVLAHLSTLYAGVGKEDAKLYIWALAWWPYAIRHGLNRLHSPLVWAPAGVNMAWISGMPGPAMVLSPITMAVSPIAALNLLLLLAPPLAAWGGTCSAVGSPARSGRRSRAATCSGSRPTRLPRCTGTRTWSSCSRSRWPRTSWFAVSRAASDASRSSRCSRWSWFTEVFLTMTVFGGLALVGAWAFGPKEGRLPVLEVTALTGAAYLSTAVLVSPYLIEALLHLPPGPIRNGNTISVDLLSFVLPRYSTLVGGPALRPITRHFLVTDVEDGAYLEAFLVVIAAFAVLERRRRSTWLLLAFVALVAMAGLGPVMHVHSHPTVVPMPWGLTAHIPLLRDAVPARLTLFLWLGTAVIVALMLARARGRIAWASWGLVAMGAITILPATSSPPYHPPVQVPAFFTSGDYHRNLRPGEVVLAIPDDRGEEILWQVEAGMYFRLARGYVGVPPDLVTTGVLGPNGEIPPYPPAFRRFVSAHSVGAVLVANAKVLIWQDELANLHVQRIRDGGLTLYQVAPRG